MKEHSLSAANLARMQQVWGISYKKIITIKTDEDISEQINERRPSAREDAGTLGRNHLPLHTKTGMDLGSVLTHERSQAHGCIYPESHLQ